MSIRDKIKKRYLLALLLLAIAGVSVWRTLNAPLPHYQTLIVRKGELQKRDGDRQARCGAQG